MMRPYASQDAILRCLARRINMQEVDHVDHLSSSSQLLRLVLADLCGARQEDKSFRPCTNTWRL